MSIFRRLVVLLDDLAPQEGAFALAADWACRLRLPIEGVSLPDMKPGSNGRAFLETKSMEVEKACADFCARLNIPWGSSRCRVPMAAGLRELIQPADLLVCGRGLAPTSSEFLREAKGDNAPALLLCPETFQPLRRILLLDQDGTQHDELFSVTAELCHYFQVGLVVLTVARSEEAARLGRQKARETLNGSDLTVDFDSLVGPESPPGAGRAAASVARWRRCQLVVTEPVECSGWRRWWPAGSRSWETDLVEAPAVLTLAGVLKGLAAPQAKETAPVPPALSPQTLESSPERPGEGEIRGGPAEPSISPPDAEGRSRGGSAGRRPMAPLH